MDTHSITLRVKVDMTAFERALAQAHAALDRLVRRAAAVEGSTVIPIMPIVLGAAVALASNAPRRFSRRSLLGLNWRRDSGA